jgi:alkylhydroperoxidase/carboxymuconolactone decarboxylase family protein YurZ
LLPDKQQKAYNDFTNAVLDNGSFDAKTTRLVLLAASLAIGCYP